MRLISTILFLIGLLLHSCQIKNKKHFKTDYTKNQVDTLDFHEYTFFNKDSTRNLLKKIKHDKKTNNELPINDKILLTLSYKNNFKRIAENTSSELISESKGLKIKKIDNYNFELFISPDYNEKTVTMGLMMSPKKNFVLKTYWWKSIIKYPEKISICKFNYIVEKNNNF